MAKRRDQDVLVAGLGRFGTSVAETLLSLGRDVLGVDADAEVVQEHAGRFAHVVEADTTDEEALRQLGAAEFRRAVVGIGTDVEASFLTTAALVDLGVEEVWAKAVTTAHGRILERVGAHCVVYPERESGERIAHRVTGRMIDYIGLDENFALVETRAPRELAGKSLRDSEVRRRFGITVVCIKSEGQAFTYATAETVVRPGDILVVAGERKRAEEFAERD
ncbi:MAG TPA: TrkA family potassium uptake protein [Actinomycetota bacterium]|nr:TrkA family potassium uptake protein [Actinomycetota bacterium]